MLVVKALTPAAELNPLFHWFFIVVLGIYVPGKHLCLYNVIFLDCWANWARLVYSLHAYDCAETQGPQEEGLNGSMAVVGFFLRVYRELQFSIKPRNAFRSEKVRV